LRAALRTIFNSPRLDSRTVRTRDVQRH
jgi:hypothetical protein